MNTEGNTGKRGENRKGNKRNRRKIKGNIGNRE